MGWSNRGKVKIHEVNCFVSTTVFPQQITMKKIQYTNRTVPRPKTLKILLAKLKSLVPQKIVKLSFRFEITG